MSAEIVAFGAKNVNPAVVHGAVTKGLPELKQLYVVGLKEDGTSIIWASSGSHAEICYAAKLLGVIADQYIREEIVDV